MSRHDTRFSRYGLRRWASSLHSHLNLCAELDDLIGRQREVLRGARRVAHHRGEEFLAPEGHAGTLRRDQGLAAEEVAGGHRIEKTDSLREPFEVLGKIGIFHEAE